MDFDSFESGTTLMLHHHAPRRNQTMFAVSAINEVERLRDLEIRLDMR